MVEILRKLEGNELAGFILVLARVTPLFLIAPPFSSPIIPPRVRGIVAVGISIGLAPIALHGQHIPTDPLTLGALVIEGGLVGLGFAFSFAVLFGAVETAGALADLGAGFSYGSLIDPFSGNENGAFSHLYSIVGIAVFFVIGGEAWVLRGLYRTFQIVPLTSAPQLTTLVGGAERVFSTVFTSALEVAAPVMIALLITDAAFGVVSRVVPQLNVFAIGFPAKIAVALLIVGATMPFVAGWISEQMSTSVGAALGALHLA
ncbi:MAG TPA: flagellar biosynthetic protein FliR [Solirubrobacteraceae bacterium]|jgi:flagellar biosynthetic protein FliR